MSALKFEAPRRVPFFYEYPFDLSSGRADAAGSLPSRFIVNSDAIWDEHALHEAVARSQMKRLAFAAIVCDLRHDVTFVLGEKVITIHDPRGVV